MPLRLSCGETRHFVAGKPHPRPLPHHSHKQVESASRPGCPMGSWFAHGLAPCNGRIRGNDWTPGCSGDAPRARAWQFHIHFRNYGVWLLRLGIMNQLAMMNHRRYSGDPGLTRRSALLDICFSGSCASNREFPHPRKLMGGKMHDAVRFPGSDGVGDCVRAFVGLSPCSEGDAQRQKHRRVICRTRRDDRSPIALPPSPRSCPRPDKGESSVGP
jgi:hypothetical protein